MSRYVVHSEDVAWAEQTHGENYALRRRALALAAGGRKLGCSLYELPPGKKGWPRHYHLANEEALFVLEGEGTLRIGEETVPIRAGDYVAMPPGEDAAHQLLNTSSAPLRYLAFSTMEAPDVMVYPDSGKMGVFAGAAPGGEKAKRTFSTFVRTDATVDYWDGEEG